MKKMITLSIIAVLAANAMAFHGAESRCSSCHLVHMASTDASSIPLWNSEQSVDYDEFTAYYEGFKMDAVVGTGPEGSTLLCLSCHDGNSHHAMVPTTSSSDMRGTHPIEFVYDAQLATDDGELQNPTTASSNKVGSSKTIEEDLLSAEGVLNCTSCHDIHAQGLHGQTTTATDSTTGDTGVIEFDMPHLVNIDGIEWQYNRRSGLSELDENAYRLIYTPLCVTCHIK